LKKVLIPGVGHACRVESAGMSFLPKNRCIPGQIDGKLVEFHLLILNLRPDGPPTQGGIKPGSGGQECARHPESTAGINKN